MDATIAFYCPNCGSGRYVTPDARSVKCKHCKRLTLFVRCPACARIGTASRYGRHRCERCGQRWVLRESNHAWAARIAEWISQETPGLDLSEGDHLLRNIQLTASSGDGPGRGSWVWMAVHPDRVVVGPESGHDAQQLTIPFGTVERFAVDGAAIGAGGDLWSGDREPEELLGGAPQTDPQREPGRGGAGPEIRWTTIDVLAEPSSLSLRAGNLTVGLARRVFAPVRKALEGRTAPVGTDRGELDETGRRAPAASAVAPPAEKGPELIEALERLERLHSSGALDDFEFKRAKRALLGG